ncbi:hypothetical protein [Actinokineospora fastidiosa]|uniref:Uncharacterized protein n=1 Tax=Actinokineospora fastidiosa TaxID=1816 RepID=A0A918GID7_9PSEU|nr:hypothetical protein [Actinokineospora fastidiosa]GGS38204.1 hypothetical protein GCM10010171_36390 [Actinokineospora fastidiosa]
MNAPNGSPDDDPFAPGGRGFLDDGVAPPVIGASPGDEVDEPAYDREPPTRPIPAQPEAQERKPGFFGRLFGR